MIFSPIYFVLVTFIRPKKKQATKNLLAYTQISNFVPPRWVSRSDNFFVFRPPYFSSDFLLWAFSVFTHQSTSKYINSWKVCIQIGLHLSTTTIDLSPIHFFSRPLSSMLTSCIWSDRAESRTWKTSSNPSHVVHIFGDREREETCEKLYLTLWLVAVYGVLDKRFSCFTRYPIYTRHVWPTRNISSVCLCDFGGVIRPTLNQFSILHHHNFFFLGVTANWIRFEFSSLSLCHLH